MSTRPDEANEPVKQRYRLDRATGRHGYVIVDEYGDAVEVYDRGEKAMLEFVDSEVAAALAAALNIGAAAIAAGAFPEDDR